LCPADATPLAPTHPPKPPPRQERATALRPDPGPAAGAGRQGRIGTSQKTILTQHLLKQKGGLGAVADEIDPREAILRHGGKDDDFSLLTAAYRKTQPKPVFAEPSDDDEDGEEGGEGGGGEGGK
jgi:WD repeat-containing protein 70